MLIKFSVNNYRGFADKIEWDLSHPSNYSFNQNAIKDNILKTASFMVLTGLEKATWDWPYST